MLGSPRRTLLASAHAVPTFQIPKAKDVTMGKQLAVATLLAVATAIPLTGAVAASGTPQRSSELPPGLLKVFAKGGLLTALMATEGSNSRLQDLPVSP